MKKAITLLCLLSTFSLVGGLTACGPNAGPSNEPSGPVKIEFWHTFGQGIQGVIEKKIKSFTKLVKENEGVDVEIKLSYQGAYDDIKTKIEKGFSAGNVPTIAVAYPDHVANYLRSESRDGQYVTNFEDLIHDEKIGFGTDAYLGDEYDETDFVEAFYEEGRHFAKPGTFTLPYMKSSEVMFYNDESVYAALKLKDPNYVGTARGFLENITWDEFIEFNEFVEQHKKEIKTTLDKPIFYDSDANLFISKMFQNEIPYSSINKETGRGNIDFAEGENYTAAKNIVKDLKTAYDKGLITTKGVEKTYGSDAFVAQKSLFSIGSSGGAGYNIPTSNDFTVGIVKVPFDNNNPLYVTQGPCLTMLKNPAHSDSETALRTTYGWKFIKYLLAPLNNVEACVVGSQGYIPVRESAFETDAFIAFLEEGEDFATTAKVLLEDINGSYLNTAVFPGSAELREIAGSIVTQSLLAKNDANLDKNIDSIFHKAIDDAKVNM